MKVSEITAQLVAEYLRLDYTDMTTAEKAELTAIMAAAKAFIKSYTGHCDETVTGEVLTEGSETVFTTKYAPIVSDSLKVYVNASQVTTGFSVDLASGTIIFDAKPATTPTADYTAGIDAFEDFPIAFYVLCQDMYDNRSLYVEKSNPNKVVETILGMHSVNLL